MFFFLSTEMQFKAITKQSPFWDRLFWRSSCGRSTTAADHLSYDHAEDYFPSYFEARPSDASDIACEGGQSLSHL
jgi:hypothetical protein